MCSSLIEGSYVGKGRYLATETELEVSRGALPSFPLFETQAQLAAAAGILVTLPVGTTNPCTGKRGGPRRAERREL